MRGRSQKGSKLSEVCPPSSPPGRSLPVSPLPTLRPSTPVIFLSVSFPSPSVSVSLVPSPQSLSLPSSPVPSRPEGAGLSWGPLAVGDCQRALTLTSSPQAPSENPGRGHHCSSWGHRGRRVRLRMGDGVQRRMENHRRGSE